MSYNKLLSVAIFFITYTGISAQNYTENRSVVKRFKVYPGTTLDVSNKYGKVEFSTWAKDSVKVEAYLSINTTSTSRIMKLRSSIDFDFSATNHYIIAKTIFKSSGNGILDEIRSFAESIVADDNEVRIDYLVTTPKNINLRLTNKYGDVYIDDIEGDIQLNISNGGLKANALLGNATVELSFANGHIDRIDKGRLILSYSDIVIKETGRVSLESKSSKISIENCESLKIQSRRDKLNLVNAKFLVGDAYFTDIRISALSEEINIGSKFGVISLDNIKKTASFINIASEYTDIDLFFEKTSTFQYDITYYKDAFVRLPKEAVKSEEKFANSEFTQKLTYGYVGSPESNTKVKISALKKASVNLFIK